VFDARHETNLPTQYTYIHTYITHTLTRVSKCVIFSFGYVHTHSRAYPSALFSLLGTHTHSRAYPSALFSLLGTYTHTHARIQVRYFLFWVRTHTLTRVSKYVISSFVYNITPDWNYQKPIKISVEIQRGIISILTSTFHTVTKKFCSTISNCSTVTVSCDNQNVVNTKLCLQGTAQCT